MTGPTRQFPFPGFGRVSRPAHAPDRRSPDLKTLGRAVFFCVVLLVPAAFCIAQDDRSSAGSGSPAVSNSRTASAEPPKPVPLELQPYRVCVSVAFGSGPDITPAFRKRVLQRLEANCRRTFGAMWSLDVRENEWLSPVGVVGLNRLTAEALQQRFGASACDKAFLLVIASDGSRVFLAAREWDAAGRTLGGLFSAETFEARAVAHEACRLIARQFRPLLAIDRVDAETVELRLRAGEFPAADPDSAQLKRGDLIQPFLQYLDREQTVQKIQSLPWTYLVVEDVDRGYVRCSLVSGLRSPLGSGSRRRVELLGLKLTPRDLTTNLRLVLQTNPDHPLSAHTVDVVMKTKIKDEEKSKPLRLLTDRTGSIRLLPQTEQPLVWLYVRSGGSLLARVPYVPGIETSGTLALPDDSLRLAVEGEIKLLQARLIDTVAERAAMMARARTLARAGRDFDTVDALIAGIKKLPDAGKFEAELTVIREPAVKRARETRNRVAESRINKMSAAARLLILQYLDPDKLRALEEEIDEFRDLAEKP